MPNTEKLVTISRLRTLLDAYGATPECWPEEERAAATALIETSSEARLLFEEAAALDSLLDRIAEPEVSAALTSRVRSIGLPATRLRPAGLLSRVADWLQPQTPRAWQGAVAMAGVLGMVAGVGLSQVMFDRGAPADRVIVTAAPQVTAPAVATQTAFPAETTFAATNVVDARAASLAPNINAISLTGEDLAADGGNLATASQADDSELTVAGIPLY